MATSVMSVNAAADQYDHQISLIDATKPASTRNESPDNLPSSSTSSSPRASARPLSKRLTKGTLREELARRKYSKWQKGRLNNHEDTAESSDENSTEPAERQAKRADPSTQAQSTDELQPIEDGHAQRHGHRNNVAHGGNGKKGKEDNEEYVIDILYENQRGLFWCGIPLYSHKSLLNFDPSPWQTATLTDSPVNITNAQVPDPSWHWAWKSWYVDMSQDVDEEGWQYSFAFTQGFAWHGTHPWFHSFCRRRRWLRKRTKRHLSRRQGTRSGMSQAHVLTADYFTIHSRSRESSTERNGNAYSSFTSRQGDGTEDEEDLDEISDINALMRALKKAPVDRAKIAVVKRFLIHGGEDIFYLAERMLDIMASLVYQNSRRQLLAYLIHACNAASEHRGEHLGKEDPKDDVQVRMVGSLQSAVHAADEQVKALEYWSDIKNVAEMEEGGEATDQCEECAPAEKQPTKAKDAVATTLPESNVPPGETDEVSRQNAGEGPGKGPLEGEAGGLDKGNRKE